MSSEFNALRVILGSRSPRRFELLSQILRSSNIQIIVADDESEPGFEHCNSLQAVLDQLRSIARLKNERVAQQVGANRQRRFILTADTVVIAPGAPPTVLGKPDGPEWQQRVRDWFRRFYFGKTHLVATAVCLSLSSGQREEVMVQTEVTFGPVDEGLLEWYISTEEPLGKAGGYGLQSAGSMFVESVRGSLSNVIGLPLKETRELLTTVSPNT